MNKKLRMIKNSLDSIEVASDYGDKEEVDKYIEISRWLIDQDDNDDLFLEADRMFEELGYEKEVWNDWIVYEHKINGGHVQFHLSNGLIHTPLTDYGVSRNHYTLFLAIYEKMKELGWIDNK